MSKNKQPFLSGDIVYHTERETFSTYDKEIFDIDFSFPTAHVTHVYEKGTGRHIGGDGRYHIEYLRHAKNSEVQWYEQRQHQS